ncbi:hypothetical protein B0H19DRAFT_170415 [Mycena capillaripes]|nr:hypothetical protein B0H19DRAFT_170415 [Mycena capillaripes]
MRTQHAEPAENSRAFGLLSNLNTARLVDSNLFCISAQFYIMHIFGLIANSSKAGVLVLSIYFPRSRVRRHDSAACRYTPPIPPPLQHFPSLLVSEFPGWFLGPTLRACLDIGVDSLRLVYAISGQRSSVKEESERTTKAGRRQGRKDEQQQIATTRTWLTIKIEGVCWLCTSEWLVARMVFCTLSSAFYTLPGPTFATPSNYKS